ncbi:unnamed protein product [Orchesella dallaii]|uniref:C2H2-type domain-containing protein n=1 Tax=Orchesella dallaii TaxID=48710 RepID=A0ABP1RMT7_9HEXA
MSQPPKFPKRARLSNEDCIDFVSEDEDNHDESSLKDGPSPSSSSSARHPSTSSGAAILPVARTPRKRTLRTPSKKAKMAMDESSSQKHNRDDEENASALTSTSNPAEALKCFEPRCYLRFGSELLRDEHTAEAHGFKILPNGRIKCCFRGNTLYPPSSIERMEEMESSARIGGGDHVPGQKIENPILRI